VAITLIKLEIALKPVLLIPCRNEEEHLAGLLEDWRFYGAEYTDLVLVLDQCTDGSEDVVQGYLDREDFPEFVVVKTEANSGGKAGAIRFGLERGLVTSENERAVILWDADREYALSGLRNIVEEAAKMAGKELWMVSGARKGDWLWSSRIANGLIRCLLRLSTKRNPPRDILTGVRVTSRKSLEESLRGAAGFDMETRVVRYFLEKQGTIKEVAVPYRPRKVGKKIKPYHILPLIRAAIL